MPTAEEISAAATVIGRFEIPSNERGEVVITPAIRDALALQILTVAERARNAGPAIAKPLVDPADDRPQIVIDGDHVWLVTDDDSPAPYAYALIHSPSCPSCSTGNVTDPVVGESMFGNACRGFVITGSRVVENGDHTIAVELQLHPTIRGR